MAFHDRMFDKLQLELIATYGAEDAVKLANARQEQMERTHRCEWRREAIPQQDYRELHGRGCNYVTMAGPRPYLDEAPAYAGPIPSDIESGRPTIGMHPGLFGNAKRNKFARVPPTGLDGAADGASESVPTPKEKKSWFSLRSAAKTEETTASTTSKSQRVKAKWRSLIDKIRALLRLRKKEKVVVETVETVETVPPPILKKKTTIIEPEPVFKRKETGSNESLLGGDIVEPPLRTRTASSTTLKNGKMKTILEPSCSDADAVSVSSSETVEEIVIQPKKVRTASISKVQTAPTLTVLEPSPVQDPVEVEEEDLAVTQPDSTVVVKEDPPDEPAPAEVVEVVEVVKDNSSEESLRAVEREETGEATEDETEEVTEEPAAEAESAPPPEAEEEVVKEEVVEEPAPEPKPVVVKAKTVVIQEPAPEPEPEPTADGGTQTTDGVSDDRTAERMPMPGRGKDKYIAAFFKSPRMARGSVSKR